MESRKIIQVEDKVPFSLLAPMSIQHMFAMFGASVLVPSLFKINPAIVLLMNGVGTLLFILITKGKAPAYLGSSFAFLAAGQAVIDKFGYQYALGGFVITGLFVCILALVIYKFGSDWIDIVLPPAAMGPVVALIGLELAGNAASNAGLLETAQYKIDDATGLFAKTITTIDSKNVIVFLVTIGVAVFGSILFRKFLAVIPILIAIVAGYITAFAVKLLTWGELCNKLNQVSFFSLPNFQVAKFNTEAVITILPVILVLASEHIGHQIVTGKVVGKDLIKDPGLHRSLFADGFSTMLSGFIGSVPTTTYGENIGVMAITRVYSVRVMAGAAVLSIISSFIGKFSVLINTIPWAVIGGVSFLLYGMIGTAGIRILVDSKVDYGKSRNLTMTSVIFVTGLSGVCLKIGNVEFKGMVLACVVGMLLGLIFHFLDKFHLTNDADDEPKEPEQANG